MSTKLKYIDSHWGIFALQGIIALLFGWFALFTSSNDIQTLVIIAGSVLASLGIVELINLLIRTRTRNTWGLSLLMAVFEIATALSLLFTFEQNVAWHLTVIAIYTITRGIFEIILGLRSIDDLTDKFSWILAGICGCIMGIVIFNAGKMGTTPFIKYFGSYMMIFGIVNLIYAVHNNEQAKDYRSEKLEQIKKTKTIKSANRKTAGSKKVKSAASGKDFKKK